MGRNPWQSHPRANGIVRTGASKRKNIARAYHDAVGAVRNRITNIANFGSGGSGVLDHRLKHLSCANDGLASNVAHSNDLLLSSKHLGGGDLNTQVATGNHDTISLGKNLWEVVEALTVLNLGNDLDVATLLAENLPNVLDVLTPADEGSKDHVDIVLDTEPEIALVLLRKGWEIDVGIGKVDTLAGRDEAVVPRLDLNSLLIDNLKNIERKHTVVDIDDTARLNDLGNVLVVDIPVRRQLEKSTETA